MAVELKQAYRRLLEEAYGRGKLEVFDEICDSGCRFHDPFIGEMDVRQAKESCRTYRTAFPDLKPTVLASYLEGDTVITQWRMTGTHQKELIGIEPTGTRCTVDGITIAKFRGGKLVEDVTQWDALGLMRQLGVAPSPETGAQTPRRETQRRI